MSKSYRTKAIAEKDNPLVPCPERLAVPTLPNYEYSISLHQDGKAYLQNLSVSTDGLQFEKEIYSASIRYDKKGNHRIKRNGQPMLYPSNSFLIKPSIVSERNKAAVENVFIIVQLIEQAGDKSTFSASLF